jgi:FecR protein
MAPGMFEQQTWPRRVKRGWIHRTGLLVALAIVVCCAPASQALAAGQLTGPPLATRADPNAVVFRTAAALPSASINARRAARSSAGRQAAASSAPCTLGGGLGSATDGGCQSTNPQVTLDVDGYGPSSCTFSTDIDWGDGSPVQTVMYPGNDATSLDAVLFTTSHTYSSPGVYTITTTSSATGAGEPTCANSGWINYVLQFTFETLLQGSPTSATVADGAGYSGQLTVTNATGTVSYTETASAHSSDVVVDSSGAISAAPALAAGTYTVSGTDSDAAGDSGTWSFTLTVGSCGTVVESVGNAPPVGTVVCFGQRITTGEGGRVTLRFPDNTELTMSENATIVLDKYVYDTPRDGHTTFFSVLQGLFVYTSGLIGKPDRNEVNIETPVGAIGIRGCVVTGAVLPGGKLLVHVVQGNGSLGLAGKPEFDFPAGEGILISGNSYQETLRLPPGAASLLAARDRPPSITAVKATGKATERPVLRFKLSDTAQVKVYVRRGKRTVVSFAGPGKKGTNKLKLSKALPKGSYSIDLMAAHEGLTSIVTSRLLIR